MKTKIYLASSWRNQHQQSLVKELRLLGYEVYDFKHPNGDPGFRWDKIEEKWQDWSMKEYREALKADYAQFGFNRDFDAMKAADICVLCLPCGRSAHLEAGWMKGAGKKVIAFIPPSETIEPELMYGLLDGIALNIQELNELL
ncbi:MAG: nucleoside 2-deoxyribosyltransferase domain-containing protein [Bacteroidales bacterium]|nr:nucleoside 2-deoxyribosyltransferase domain-containing protein [Bacteroidales bacterium]